MVIKAFEDGIEAFGQRVDVSALDDERGHEPQRVARRRADDETFFSALSAITSAGTLSASCMPSMSPLPRTPAMTLWLPMSFVSFL